MKKWTKVRNRPCDGPSRALKYSRGVQVITSPVTGNEPNVEGVFLSTTVTCTEGENDNERALCDGCRAGRRLGSRRGPGPLGRQEGFRLAKVHGDVRRARTRAQALRAAGRQV